MTHYFIDQVNFTFTFDASQDSMSKDLIQIRRFYWIFRIYDIFEDYNIATWLFVRLITIENINCLTAQCSSTDKVEIGSLNQGPLRSWHPTLYSCSVPEPQRERVLLWAQASQFCFPLASCPQVKQAGFWWPSGMLALCRLRHVLIVTGSFD